MNDSQDCSYVYEPVNHLPTLAQFANGRLCRSQGEWNQQQKCGETDGNEGPLDHVLGDAVQVKKLVEPDIGGEVQAGVEKREQPEHPTKLDKPVLPGQLADRSDG